MPRAAAALDTLSSLTFLALSPFLLSASAARAQRDERKDQRQIGVERLQSSRALRDSERRRGLGSF